MLIGLALIEAVLSDPATWPAEALEVQSACGFSWDWLDVRRFLSKSEVRPIPGRAGQWHRIWIGARSRGQGNTQWYGSFRTKGKTVRAHKFAGVAVYGFRPAEGEELDHECHQSLCVSCVRVLTKKANRDRIRRPTGAVLRLARQTGISAAELMLVPTDKLVTYQRMADFADNWNNGALLPGFITNQRTGKTKRCARP